MYLPVLALFLLAPWTAECSWGGFAVAEFPFVVAILAPMYGGAAVLIREAARRAGRGWPTIVLLAAAYGFVQAGLVDQSLLNPQFLADTEFREIAAESRSSLIPGVGISVEQLLDYVGNHIALSICAPIAIVESIVGPQRRHQPWLGRVGLAVVAVVYVGGSLLIYSDTAGSDAFAPSAGQVAVVAGVALVLIGAAFAHRQRPRTVRSDQGGVGSAPAARVIHPVWVGVLVVAAHLGSWLGTGWMVAIRLALISVVVAVIVAWSGRPGWGQQHVLAAWGAGLVMAAVTAYLVPNYAPASPQSAVISDIAVSLITASLLVAASRRLRPRLLGSQRAS